MPDKTTRKLITEEEAWEAMTNVVFDGSVDLRHIRDVIEEQVPILRDLTIEQAINTATAHESLEKAHQQVKSILGEINTQIQLSNEREELIIRQGAVLSELMSIKDTSARVVDFISNISTVIVNFDMWLSSSVSFATRWLKVIHPSVLSEALEQLPLPLLLSIRESLDRAITIVSSKIINIKPKEQSD